MGRYGISVGPRGKGRGKILIAGRTYGESRSLPFQQVGKMKVWRISLHFGSLGMATVSLPEQGAPPTNWLSEAEVQHRWQMLESLTLLVSVLVAEPTSIRKPFLKAVVLPLGM
jgi:hypothetical protein